MENKYIFDTNSIVGIGQRHYPKDLFDELWQHIYSQISSEAIMVSNGVVEEIEEKIDDSDANRNSWRDDFLASIKPSSLILHEDFQPEFNEIANKCNNEISYRGGKQQSSVGKFLSKADVWLIAIAKKNNLTLISEELPGSLKIPTICQLENVKCINTIEYFRSLSLRFGTTFA